MMRATTRKRILREAVHYPANLLALNPPPTAEEVKEIVGSMGQSETRDGKLGQDIRRIINRLNLILVDVLTAEAEWQAVILAREETK